MNEITFDVAILILLELTLQLELLKLNYLEFKSRNPYFIGINSAIHQTTYTINSITPSQSLFYWN